MVKYVIAEQLIGKEVVTSDGIDLGRFLDAEINEVTGKLVGLLVEAALADDCESNLEVSGLTTCETGNVMVASIIGGKGSN